MNPPLNVIGQFGDTTYTKVFVGGLAWETQRDTMRKYFDQFGEILEAVVISDKSTGRSKGYGFVTFLEPEAAMRACVDPAPVIDGRRTNCNLASLGLQKPKTISNPLNGGSRNFRVVKSFQGGGGGGGGGGVGGVEAAFASQANFPAHYAIQQQQQQQGMPYNVFGYSPYSSDYSTYPTSFYNFYGGAAAHQYPLYGGTTTNGMMAGTTSGYYPYFHLGQGTAAGAAAYGQGQGYGMQYQQMLQYPAAGSTAGVTGFPAAQLYGGPLSLAPSPPAQAGMTMAFTAPTLQSPTGHHYRLIPAHFSASTAPEQSLA